MQHTLKWLSREEGEGYRKGGFLDFLIQEARHEELQTDFLLS